MLASWMLYTIALGAIVAGAGAALERLAEIWIMPRRGIWAASLVVAVFVPMLLALRPHPVPAIPSDEGVVRVSIPVSSIANSKSSAPALSLIDRITLASRAAAPYMWAGSTFVCVALIIGSFFVVARRRAQWREATVDGHRVLVAPSDGPAVIGAVRPQIVIPSWALDLSDEERRVMLRHESEHVRAGDPALLLVSAILVSLMPWNPALWLIAYRLRLAIEIDCDRRVLRALSNPRDYGLLLLAVGARNRFTLPLAASLAERKPLIERRILAMTSLRPARPLLASLPFALIAGAAAALAAQTPRPSSLIAAERDSVATQAVLSKVAATTASLDSIFRLKRTNAAALERAMTEQARTQQAATREIGRMNADAYRGDTVFVVGADQKVRAFRGDTVVIRRDTAGTQARVPRDIPVDTIAVWIALHHPAVIRGDGNLDRVTILVDANDRYVSSVAEAAGDRRLSGIVDEKKIDRVEVLKGPAAAALYGPAAANGVITITTKDSAANAAARVETLVTELRARERAVGSDPIIVVDGAVVQPDRVAAPGLPVQFNIDANQIQSVDVLKFAPGRIAPNQLSVIVVKLKAGR